MTHRTRRKVIWIAAVCVAVGTLLGWCVVGPIGIFGRSVLLQIAGRIPYESVDFVCIDGRWLLARDGAVIHPSGCEGIEDVGSSRVDLQACKLEYSIVSPK